MKRWLILALMLVGAEASAQPANYAQYISEMLTHGDLMCDNQTNSALTFDQKLGTNQYDAIRSFFNIYDYTCSIGPCDSTWLTCKEAAEDVYRDGYVIKYNGGLPEQYNTGTGIRMDYERTGDTLSRDAVGMLRQNAAYCTVNYSTKISAANRYDAVRIIGHCTKAHLDALAIGLGENATQNTARLAHREALFGVYDDFFISKNVRCGGTVNHGCYWDGVPANGYFVQPHYWGIAMEAMIREYEYSGDTRVEPAIKTIIDWLWDNSWDPEGFDYVTQPSGAVDDTDGPWLDRTTLDISLQIVPAFYWYYKQSGNSTYLTRADEIFNSGVVNGNTDDGGKRFNQHYQWSMQGLAWRAEGLSGPPAPAFTSSGALPNGTVGIAYSELVPVSGGAEPYAACTVTAGSLPAGSPAFAATPTADGCLITGTPNAASTYNFTLEVEADDALTDEEDFSITTVATAPTITTGNLPNGLVGVAYSATVACSGGTAPYAFSVASGALCPGLSLNASSGAITGTPPVEATCTYTIRCTDDNTLFDDQAYTNTTIAGEETMAYSLNPSSTSFVTSFGFSTLKYEDQCQIDVRRGTDVVETAVLFTGRSTRQIEIGLLTPETEYNVTYSCQTIVDSPSVALTTLVASAGTAVLPFSIGPPTANLSAATHAELQCSYAPDMTGSASTGCGDCTSGCSLSLTRNTGISYCRVRRTNSGCSVLATSTVQPYNVP